MARLEGEVPDDLPVRFVSFTVDPEFDTPEILQTYAESFGVPDRWLFLTGEPKELYRLTLQGFKLALDPAPPPGVSEEPILHSTRFVLVDGEGRVRGYYGAFDEEEMERLRGDLVGLAG
jgi:protein SCO1